MTYETAPLQYLGVGLYARIRPTDPLGWSMRHPRLAPPIHSGGRCGDLNPHAASHYRSPA